MTKADDIQRLVERIEGLAKSDTAVNDDIARALGWTQHSDEADPVYTRRPQLWWAEPGEEWSTMTVVPNYTGSVDAALSLVPEGWWAVADTLGRASVYQHSSLRSAMGTGPTPALALASAALRARITERTDPPLSSITGDE